jgi:chromosome segregation ATPase
VRIGELENLILEAKRKNNNLANDFLSLEKEYNGLKNKLADTNTNLNDNLKRLESANSEIDKVIFFFQYFILKIFRFKTRIKSIYLKLNSEILFQII